ncbi:hypothetical protein PG994_007888 [Apiospora phragmitis]|uniref:Uncharacterized protein n=1 Tax=Apiospora phragmitis TaxID=2905665 RepID=A0ABR1US68_9PEZI
MPLGSASARGEILLLRKVLFFLDEEFKKALDRNVDEEDRPADEHQEMHCPVPVLALAGDTPGYSQMVPVGSIFVNSSALLSNRVQPLKKNR